MSSTITQLLNHNFGGIRRKDSYFSEEKITCSDCQNVELYYTQLNSAIGLRTVKGNTSITSYEETVDGVTTIKNHIPDDEKVVGLFQTTQLGVDYMMVYTESESQGRLSWYDMEANTIHELKSGLTVTGNACATDFSQGWLDMFIFSNGEELVYVYSNTETLDKFVLESSSNLHLTDQDGRTVHGLGLVVWDSRLWVFNDKVLWYSQQSECRNFLYNSTETVTSAGYIEYVKPITAIWDYLSGSLAVFHKDSSSLLTVDSTTGFKKDEESPGGCAGYSALVYHGTDLYFYDDTKKGVFSFKQIVNGDKTLGDNIALDIQDELMQIPSDELNKIRALSVVTEDRNEVWFLVPISDDENYSYILIYDYLRGEWVKRKCPVINAITVYNSDLYSGGKHIYQEYSGHNFNGEYIPSFYTCTILNMGADNTLKITKFPPRITVDSKDYSNNFLVKYVKNYNLLKNPKIKKIKCKSSGNILVYDQDKYDTIYQYQVKTVTQILKLPSATFKALEVTFYTEEVGQSFCIKAIEFSKIKVKQV